jgi:hypothetical protein
LMLLLLLLLLLIITIIIIETINATGSTVKFGEVKVTLKLILVKFSLLLAYLIKVGISDL